MKKGLRIALCIALTAVFATGIGNLVWQGYRAAENAAANREAQELAELPDTAPPLQELPELPTEQADPELQPEETGEPVFEDAFAASLLEVDLAALQAVNEDVVGWIVIPDTPVSYPLLQGEDNSYYLNHTWEKEYNPGGSIFLECKNSPDLNNFNTIIFGHRMSDSSMFNSLRHYDEQDYLEAHPRIYIATESGVRVYEIFAAMKVTVTDPVYWLITTQESHKQPMVDFCLGNSVLTTELVPSAEDRFITLSTCTGLTAGDDRWVVVGVEVGEIERPPEQLLIQKITGDL